MPMDGCIGVQTVETSLLMASLMGHPGTHSAKVRQNGVIAEEKECNFILERRF